VIVVGAGIAGLAAARDLARGGTKVVVLEARARAGGRILTQRDQGSFCPVELGAEFVHGGNRALSALIAESGLKTRVVPERHWIVRDGRRRSIPGLWDRVDRVMQRIGPTYSSSFESWIRGPGRQLRQLDRAIAQEFVAGFQGAPLARMSAHALFVAASIGEGAQSRVVGGYDQLIGFLQGELGALHMPVHLNSSVHRVRWSPHEVTAWVGDRAWSASLLLVTVPLGVLREPRRAQGAIHFEPRLAQKQNLWDKVEPGHVRRVVFRLRDNAWRSRVLPSDLRARQGRGFGFLHSDEPEFPVWWSEAPAPLLVGWAGGAKAERLAGLAATEIFQRALQALARVLRVDPAALAGLVVESRTHDWSTDPFTRGAYSFSVARAEDVPGRLAAPVDNTIFFAGEATADPLELGTVHGALSSGQRAAKEMLNALA